MKPLNFKNQNAKNIARVKTLIKAHLSWMSGFPTINNDGKLIWVYTDSNFYHDQTAEIDARKLSKSQRTVSTLFRDYPVALPAVVGDATLWHKRCVDYINHAKNLISSKPGLIPSLFELDQRYRNEIKRGLIKHHDREELLAQISWKHYLNRSNINISLQFIQNHQLNNNRLDPISLINLITLHVLEKSRSKGLVDFLLNTHEIDILCDANYEFFTPYLKYKSTKSIQKHRKTFNPDKFPDAQNKPILNRFLQNLSTLSAPQLRRSLLFFQHLKIENKLNQWHNWWGKMTVLCQKIHNHIIYASVVNLNEINSLQDQVNNLFKQKPTHFKLDSVFDSIINFAKINNVAVSVVNIIETINQDDSVYPSSESFMQHFSQLLTCVKPNKNKFINYLSGLNNYLKLNVSANIQAPWQTITDYIWGSIDAELMEDTSKAHINIFFDALVLITSKDHQKLRKNHLFIILNLTKAEYQAESIYALYLSLYKSKKLSDFPLIVAKIANYYNLAHVEIIELLKVQDKLFNNDSYVDGLEVMFHIFQQSKQQDFFKEFLLKYDTNQLLRDSFLIRVINKISGAKAIPQPPSYAPKVDKWILEYPKIFHPLIEKLNGVSLEAKSKVKQIFKSTWWPKILLKTEIVKLESYLQKNKQVKTDVIEQRIANLRAQLDKHKAVSGHKTNKIKQKIDEQINQSYFSSWQLLLEHQFLKDWSAFFKLDQEHMPAWLIDSQYIEKLIHILDFDNNSQHLAIKIIGQRIHGVFSYLENEPKNHQFMQKITTEGVNLSCWPKDLGELQYQLKNGEEIILSLEKDPLEILGMGSHFSTCLSPGDMNYFSVFSNIADVNKQVIFARNCKNKVVGRVLIGITSQGGLQVFHRYSHHKDYLFNQHILLFIDQIIEKTGLTLSHHGQVDPLCCNDWYDDGATQFNHSIPCFKDGSTFRSEISTMSFDDFFIKLHKALGSKQLNSLILLMLLNLPETKENPNLYPALLKLSIITPNVSVYDLLLFYKLAHTFGQAASCYESHKKVLFKYFLKQAANYWVDYDCIGKIAEHHPSDALKIIKAHAKLEKHDWKVKPVYMAGHATYVALKKLGRDQLAETIKEISEKN